MYKCFSRPTNQFAAILRFKVGVCPLQRGSSETKVTSLLYCTTHNLLLHGRIAEQLPLLCLSDVNYSTSSLRDTMLVRSVVYSLPWKRWFVTYAILTLDTKQTFASVTLHRVGNKLVQNEVEFVDANDTKCRSLHGSTKIPKLNLASPCTDLHRSSCQTYTWHENRADLIKSIHEICIGQHLKCVCGPAQCHMGPGPR